MIRDPAVRIGYRGIEGVPIAPAARFVVHHTSAAIAQRRNDMGIAYCLRVAPELELDGRWPPGPVSIRAISRIIARHLMTNSNVFEQ